MKKGCRSKVKENSRSRSNKEQRHRSKSEREKKMEKRKKNHAREKVGWSAGKKRCKVRSTCILFVTRLPEARSEGDSPGEGKSNGGRFRQLSH